MKYNYLLEWRLVYFFENSGWYKGIITKIAKYLDVMYNIKYNGGDLYEWTENRYNNFKKKQILMMGILILNLLKHGVIKKCHNYFIALLKVWW